MGATANATGPVQESNGSNNQRTTPITVQAQAQLRNLVVSALSVGSTTVRPGNQVTVTFTVINHRLGAVYRESDRSHGA